MPAERRLSNGSFCWHKVLHGVQDNNEFYFSTFTFLPLSVVMSRARAVSERRRIHLRLIIGGRKKSYRSPRAGRSGHRRCFRRSWCL